MNAPGAHNDPGKPTAQVAARSAPSTTRLRPRRLRVVCASCGYDLAHRDSDCACPECACTERVTLGATPFTRLSALWPACILESMGFLCCFLAAITAVSGDGITITFAGLGLAFCLLVGPAAAASELYYYSSLRRMPRPLRPKGATPLFIVVVAVVAAGIGLVVAVTGFVAGWAVTGFGNIL